MQTLEKRRQGLEERLRETEEITQKAKRDRERAQQELSRVKQLADEEIKKAKEEAQQISAKTRAQAYAILDRLEQAEKKKGLSAQEKAELRAGIRKMDDSADPIKEKSNSGYTLPRALKKGDGVLIFDIDKKGTVLEEADTSGKVLVQAGIIKTRVPLDNLRLLNEKPQKEIVRSTTRNVKGAATARPVTDVDLRGMTAIEAIMELENAIDSAILSGIGQITVIHGKGTGVLRREVHAHLKGNKAVKSFRLGVYGEGESGVTIVELK